MVGRRDRPERRGQPRARGRPDRDPHRLSRPAPASNRNCPSSNSPPENDGIAGARLAIEDNNTTGKFLNQRFSLEEVRLKDGDDVGQGGDGARRPQHGFIIADLPADALLKAADALRDRGTVLFNAGAIDDRLREQDCRANVIHVAPTRSMLADALAQYLVWKQWKRWLLVVGSHEEDKLYADALRRAATRFGAKIVQERVFEDTGGARRTDSGVTLIQRQMPVFTPAGAGLRRSRRGRRERSVRVLSALPDLGPAAGRRLRRPGADELGRGARPVGRDPDAEPLRQTEFAAHDGAGHAGLDRGAHDRRSRIAHQFRRSETVFDFLKGPDFSVAAFKGQRLTLRDWNLQLRQPILLVDGRMVVSVSPQEGFLHQVSELDTLGFDRPETKCKLN